MKRNWVKVIIVMTMAMALVLGTAMGGWAGQFTSPKDKAKAAAIDKRLAAEKAAIAKKYAKADMERQAAKVTAPQPAVKDGGRAMPSPIKTAILTPFVTVGTGLMALGEGFNYVTKSMFETPVSQACRAVNTAKSQLLYHPINVATEFFTGFTGNTQYYDPTKLNWLGERAQKRGPIAQMAEMAGTAIPIIATSTGIVAPFVASMTVPEMVFTTGAISAVGSIGVGEAFDAGEKKLVK